MESISGIERNEMEVKKKSAFISFFLRVIEFIGEKKKNLTRCETKAAGVDVSFDRHQ